MKKKREKACKREMDGGRKEGKDKGETIIAIANKYSSDSMPGIWLTI